MGKVRVCVADDCLEVADVLCEGLRLHNYNAFAVHTGREALNACQNGGVDLILLDINLPDMSGYDVCALLKENPATRDIVVIFVTVRGAAHDVEKGFRVGAADYIHKPARLPHNLPMVMVRVDAAVRDKLLQQRSDVATEIIYEDPYTDTLTGLRNKRFLMERLQEEVDKSHRYTYPVSCAVFDLDEVRALDDELGPVSMDDLLAEVAMILRNHTRTYDVLARYDNTLFAAVLPHMPLHDARRYAERILEEMSATTFSDPNFPTEASLSIGLVACKNGTALGAEHVLGETMRSLFQAKSLKGMRVVSRDL